MKGDLQLNQINYLCQTYHKIPRYWNFKTNLLLHIEEKEAKEHSTLVIKDFSSFQVDRTVVMFKIRCQSLKKSFNLYIIIWLIYRRANMKLQYKIKLRTTRNDFSPSHPIKRMKTLQMKLAGGRFKVKKNGYLFLTSIPKIQNFEPQVVLQTPKCTEFKKKLGKNNGNKTHPFNADTKYENTTSDPENPWAIGHWQLLGQYWGIMIQVSSSLHLSLQKAGQGEAMNFNNEKSKHFTACLLLCAHWGSWDNGAAVLASTHDRAREAVTAPGPLPEASHPLHRWWGCTLGCSAACCSSHPASLRWQPWLQPTAPGPSSPGGCTGPSVTISPRWPHWEAPGLPEGLQDDALLPCPSQS